MKALDAFFVWIIIIAIAAVVVGSGQTDALITGVAKLLAGLIGIVDAPQTSH